MLGTHALTLSSLESKPKIHKTFRYTGKVSHQPFSAHQWSTQDTFWYLVHAPCSPSEWFPAERTWAMKLQALTPRSIPMDQHGYIAVRQSQEMQFYELISGNPKKMDSPKKCLPLSIILYNVLMNGLTVTQVCRRHVHDRQGCTIQSSRYLIQAMAATSNCCQKQTTVTDVFVTLPS